MDNSGRPRTAPLLDLSKEARDVLMRQINIDARNNIENILGIPRTDPRYKLQVNLEINKLINHWIDTHQ